MNRYEKMKDNAYNLSHTIDLSGFSEIELCEIYCNLNSSGWDNRLGVIPKQFNTKYGCHYSCAIMDRIADKIGDKAVSKWWNVNYQKRMTEEEYEIWYEKKIQKIVLRRN